MKKYFLLAFSSVLLSGCSVYANENGVAAYGKNGSIRISSGAIIAIVVCSVLVLGLTALGLYVYKIKDAKKQMEMLKEKLKNGEITQEQFDFAAEKLKKFIKR